MAAVLVQNVSKVFRLYRRPSDRIFELLPFRNRAHTDFWALSGVSIAVERGDHVDAGQVIGTAVSSGDVEVPQLHFEIRRGVRPVDPKSLLPKSLIVASN